MSILSVHSHRSGQGGRVRNCGQKPPRMTFQKQIGVPSPPPTQSQNPAGEDTGVGAGLLFRSVEPADHTRATQCPPAGGLALGSLRKLAGAPPQASLQSLALQSPPCPVAPGFSASLDSARLGLDSLSMVRSRWRRGAQARCREVWVQSCTPETFQLELVMSSGQVRSRQRPHASRSRCALGCACASLGVSPVASRGEAEDPRAVAAQLNQVSPRACPLCPPPGHSLPCFYLLSP